MFIGMEADLGSLVTQRVAFLAKIVNLCQERGLAREVDRRDGWDEFRDRWGEDGGFPKGRKRKLEKD
jgi:hypothetical protein